eukprot:3867280-Prorocentrum_lima.AAC.1
MDSPELAQLFQRGGSFTYPEGLLTVTGIQHVVHRFALHFQEHAQEELLRVSAEYMPFFTRTRRIS